MSYKSYKSNKSYNPRLIPPHGGYSKFETNKKAEIISDLNLAFTNKFKSYLTYKNYEKMNKSARSGKQCIVEGSYNSVTSKKIELKLIGNARGSYEELLEDYLDILRQRKLTIWSKDSDQAQKIRKLAYKSNRSYLTYKSYVEFGNLETATNTLIYLIYQENYLLDKLLQKLEKDFLEKVGFTERLYKFRKGANQK